MCRRRIPRRTPTARARAQDGTVEFNPPKNSADIVRAAGPIDEDNLLKNLPVLNGAIMESMRLYPIAVAQIRTVVQDFEFEGYRIKQGDMLYVSAVVPHFMDEYYPEAKKFDVGILIFD